MTEHCQLHITHLPDELNGRIAQLLEAKDALHFAESCKSMLQSLALSCCTVGYAIMVDWSGGYLNGDTPLKHRRIPVVSDTHTVVVSLQWCDQGWGNLKGQIYVVASRESDPPLVLPPPQCEDVFDGGRLVYESPIASHTEEPLHFSFSPKPDETYDLWYKPGGGGGHTLSLRNVRIQLLVQGDVDGDLHRNNCTAAEQEILDARLYMVFENRFYRILPTPELIVPQQQPSPGIFRFVKKMCCCNVE